MQGIDGGIQQDMRHFRVEKYNPEHYIDLTAAIAVSRADRRKTIAFVALGGSYRIGDIYRFEWKNGVLHIWEYK